MQRFAIYIKQGYVSNTGTRAKMEYSCFLNFKVKPFDSNLNIFMNNLIFFYLRGNFFFFLQLHLNDVLRLPTIKPNSQFFKQKVLLNIEREKIRTPNSYKSPLTMMRKEVSQLTRPTQVKIQNSLHKFIKVYKPMTHCI